MAVDTARHLHLGAAATEARVKELSANGTLAGYRIVHFATHAAFAGQLRTGSDDVLDEPGLVLTPPATASATDDGYLSSSEIAALKLDADWVILSACNTGGGDTREENGLAGLAPAFFSAGARALLVSQWEVYSAETVLLITHALETLRTEPGAGRAEALRRSMVNMIDRGKPELAHPAFWGPFIVVGEGGQGR